MSPSGSAEQQRLEPAARRSARGRAAPSIAPTSAHATDAAAAEAVGEDGMHRVYVLISTPPMITNPRTTSRCRAACVPVLLSSAPPMMRRDLVRHGPVRRHPDLDAAPHHEHVDHGFAVAPVAAPRRSSSMPPMIAVRSPRRNAGDVTRRCLPGPDRDFRHRGVGADRGDPPNPGLTDRRARVGDTAGVSQSGRSTPSARRILRANDARARRSRRCASGQQSLRRRRSQPNVCSAVSITPTTTGSARRTAGPTDAGLCANFSDADHDDAERPVIEDAARPRASCRLSAVSSRPSDDDDEAEDGLRRDAEPGSSEASRCTASFGFGAGRRCRRGASTAPAATMKSGHDSARRQDAERVHAGRCRRGT